MSILKSVDRVSRICKNLFSCHFRFHAETFDFDFQKEASHKMSQNVTKPCPLPDLSIFVMPMLQFFSLPECCFDELQVGGRCGFGRRLQCHPEIDWLIRSSFVIQRRRCAKVCLQDYEFEGFFWPFPASHFICEHCSFMLLSSHQVPDWVYETTSQSVDSEEKDKIDKQAGNW